MDEYRDLFRGVDAVVHLAHLRPASDSLHDRYLAERGDVDMAYLVYQLALDEGVKRVVVASSNHATDFYERPLRAGQMDTVYPERAAAPAGGQLLRLGQRGLRAPRVRVRLGGRGRADRWRGAAGGSAAQAGGRPDPDLRPARPEHHVVRGLAQGRSADAAPRSRAVGQPARSGAVVRQVDRGAEHRGRVRHPVPGVLRRLGQHPVSRGASPTPAGSSATSRRTTRRWCTPTRSAR